MTLWAPWCRPVPSAYRYGEGWVCGRGTYGCTEAHPGLQGHHGRLRDLSRWQRLLAWARKPR